MRMACLASELSSSTAICHPSPHRWRSTFPQIRGIGRWSSPKRLQCASINVRCYFQLIPPPYPLSSLEPYMSQETVERHWGRHHREHLNSLNTHIAGSELNEMPLEEIVLASYNKGDCLPVFIHAAQTWNHDFFWQSMKPGGGGRPSGILLQLIERDFGSFELFLKEFKTAALTQFGSGWVWLTYKSNRLDVGNAVNPCPSAEDNKLVVAKTPNAINPLVWDYSKGRGWRTFDGVELRPYFSLRDLWESFKEWSAYGAGVPLVLNSGDCVVQYYVPYLSAIQLYTDASRTTLRSRQPGEESDARMYQGTSSDVSSESEAERAVRKRRDSSTTTSHKDQNGLVGEENGVCQQTMLPVFEYLEHNPPYGREPLADKISLLANKFPQLKTYRSYDLLPTSWFSVAWYPIYRIPTGPTLRDLDACFLSFHTLSTPLKNSCNGHSELNDSCRVREANDFTQMSAKLSLPVLGLASYKLKGSIWTNRSLYEQQRASSLLQDAENWLQLRKVDHPDFRFFLAHYNTS